MDIKLNKGKLSKMIQSRVVLCNTQGKLGKKVIADLAILPGLVNILSSNVVNKCERKNHWKRSCQSRKKVYFVCLKWRYESYF